MFQMGGNLGCTKLDERQPPSEQLHIHHLRTATVQLLTEEYSPRNGGMPMMGSVRSLRVSGAPDGSGRQRETTYEAFSCSQSCAQVAQKAKKNAKNVSFQAKKGAQHNGCITDEHMAATRRLLFSRRTPNLVGTRRRRCCWAPNHVPMMGTSTSIDSNSNLLGPAKVQKWANKLRIRVAYLRQPFYSQEIRTDLGSKPLFSALIPSRIFMFAETPTRGDLTTHS